MNILLVYGGNSCEHDISVITACLAKGYFDGNLYSAYFTQLSKDVQEDIIARTEEKL